MLSWRKIRRPSSPALAISARVRRWRSANSSRVKWSAIRRLLMRAHLRYVPFNGRAPTSSSLGHASEYLPLPGKQRLDPIDNRTHAGGAAQIPVDDDPVFGCDFEDRRSQPLEQRMAVADIAGQYPAAGTGADCLQMHQHR